MLSDAVMNISKFEIRSIKFFDTDKKSIYKFIWNVFVIFRPVVVKDYRTWLMQKKTTC